MSKSKKNVIDPNILLDKYGADTTRLFCLFAAPPQRDLEWSEQGVEGSFRFLNRVWHIASNCMDCIKDIPSYYGSPDELYGESRDLYRKTHHTIKKVTIDIEDKFHFNTAISAIMELVNAMSGIDLKKNGHKENSVVRYALESIVLLLAPIVPHFAEELWEALGYESSILLASWPEYNKEALSKDELLIVVQVNGKLRSRFNIDADTDDNAIKEMALSDERIKKFINGKAVRKIIVVKKKLVNIVI